MNLKKKWWHWHPQDPARTLSLDLCTEKVKQVLLPPQRLALLSVWSPSWNRFCDFISKKLCKNAQLKAKLISVKGLDLIVIKYWSTLNSWPRWESVDTMMAEKTTFFTALYDVLCLIHLKSSANGVLVTSYLPGARDVLESGRGCQGGALLWPHSANHSKRLLYRIFHVVRLLKSRRAS